MGARWDWETVATNVALSTFSARWKPTPVRSDVDGGLILRGGHEALSLRALAAGSHTEGAAAGLVRSHGANGNRLANSPSE
jgi:hypothetical protein